jgi:hypothetical protein
MIARGGLRQSPGASWTAFVYGEQVGAFFWVCTWFGIENAAQWRFDSFSQMRPFDRIQVTHRIPPARQSATDFEQGLTVSCGLCATIV